jgi:hypothetical protein
MISKDKASKNGKNSKDYNYDIYVEKDKFAEIKEKVILSKYDFDLYDEEKNKKNTIYKIKKTLSNKIDSWYFYKNDKIDFIIDSNKITKAQANFLYSPEGISKVLTKYRIDNKSYEEVLIYLQEMTTAG